MHAEHKITAACRSAKNSRGNGWTLLINPLTLTLVTPGRNAVRKEYEQVWTYTNELRGLVIYESSTWLTKFEHVRTNYEEQSLCDILRVGCRWLPWRHNALPHPTSPPRVRLVSATPMFLISTEGKQQIIMYNRKTWFLNVAKTAHPARFSGWWSRKSATCWGLFDNDSGWQRICDDAWSSMMISDD